MSFSYRKCAASAALAALGLAALCAGRPADAQTAYVEAADGSFGTVDLQSGGFTQLNDPKKPLPIDFYALGFGTDGTLYGLTNGSSGTDLYTINPTNGDLLTETPAVSANSINGGTMVGNTFYALSSDPSATLFTVTVGGGTTVSQTVQYNTGIEADGMTVLDGSGSLYAADSSPNAAGSGDDAIEVIKQDGTSSGPTVLGSGDSGLGYLYSGVYANNTLYGFGDDASDTLGVYRISTTDGSSSLSAVVSGVGSNVFYAAALAPVPAPEPAPGVAYGCGILGIGALMLRARRRGRASA